MSALHFRTALLPDGWARDVRIGIDGGRIASVATAATPSATDERHAIAIPGMSSLHSHAFQRGMAGLAEVRGTTADSFWTWREMMYRFALSMTPEDAQSIATLLYCELLEAGFTRVGEFHYVHHDRDGTPYADIAEMAGRVAAAADATGIGLTLLPTFYAHSDFGGAAPNPGQRRFVCSLDQYARLIERATDAIAELPSANIGIAPHSLRAATPDEIKVLASLLPDAPMHIHVAEQTKEVDDCLSWSGKRPVEWLLANAEIDRRWCLIHATHMTVDETIGLARSDAVAGLCPLTEAGLGDGVFAGALFQQTGGSYGIGSDSNSLIGVADELRQLEFSQRLALRQRNVMAGSAAASTGRALFDGALTGGAQALGQPDAGLAIGARADIVTLDAKHPSLAGRNGDRLLDGWIFAAGRDVVDCVWAGGVRQVTGGRHHKRDAARGTFNATVARLVA